MKFIFGNLSVRSSLYPRHHTTLAPAWIICQSQLWSFFELLSSEYEWAGNLFCLSECCSNAVMLITKGDAGVWPEEKPSMCCTFSQQYSTCDCRPAQACRYRSAVHPLETGGGECPDLMDYYMRPRCTGTWVLMWLFNPRVGRDLAVSSPPQTQARFQPPVLHITAAEVTQIAPLTWLGFAGSHSALACHPD